MKRKRGHTKPAEHYFVITGLGYAPPPAAIKLLAPWCNVVVVYNTGTCDSHKAEQEEKDVIDLTNKMWESQYQGSTCSGLVTIESNSRLSTALVDRIRNMNRITYYECGVIYLDTNPRLLEKIDSIDNTIPINISNMDRSDLPFIVMNLYDTLTKNNGKMPLQNLRKQIKNVKYVEIERDNAIWAFKDEGELDKDLKSIYGHAADFPFKRNEITRQQASKTEAWTSEIFRKWLEKDKKFATFLLGSIPRENKDS